MYFRTAIEVISSSLLMYFHKMAFCITIIMQIIKFYLYFFSEKQCFKVLVGETKKQTKTNLCNFE